MVAKCRKKNLSSDQTSTFKDKRNTKQKRFTLVRHYNITITLASISKASMPFKRTPKEVAPGVAAGVPATTELGELTRILYGAILPLPLEICLQIGRSLTQRLDRF
jgi:hypothetical protein